MKPSEAKPNQQIRKRRVIVYIDGFNLYFALREKQWFGFMWLDMLQLGTVLVREDQELVQVKYFTSRIRNDPEKQKRQNLFLDALGTLDSKKLKIYYGDYQTNELKCFGCGNLVRDDHEKQTDVNIATQMILDAFSKDSAGQPKVDDIILITADSDQCPAIMAVRSLGKHVLVVLPPGRGHYLEIQKVADSKLELTAKKLKKCRMPDRIASPSGFVIECIAKWKN